MSAKNKKETPTEVAETVVAEQEIQPQEMPPPEVPEVQAEKPTIENQVEPPAESKAEIVSAIVEPVPEKVEKPAESIATKPETAPTVEVPALKPKPVTLASLHAQLEELEKKFLEQSNLISQILATPIKTRKPVASNGKVQIKDTLTGKIYPSKNNVYQTLLKSGELDELVKKGVFGSGDAAKNSFGCYALFRSFPGRFEEIKHQEANTNLEQKPA